MFFLALGDDRDKFSFTFCYRLKNEQERQLYREQYRGKSHKLMHKTDAWNQQWILQSGNGRAITIVGAIEKSSTLLSQY